MLKIQGRLLISSGTLLLVWWVATGILFWEVGQFEAAVQHVAWMPINVLGLLGCLLCCLGLPALTRVQIHPLLVRNEGHETGPAGPEACTERSSVESVPQGAIPVNRAHFSDTLGILLSQAGLILYTAIQYYETFLWPVAAKTNPALVEIQGPFVFGHWMVAAPLIISGLVLSLGFLFLLFQKLRTERSRMWPWLLFLGVTLFGIGMVIPVRTLGLFLMTAALIRYGSLASVHSQSPAQANAATYQRSRLFTIRPGIKEKPESRTNSGLEK